MNAGHCQRTSLAGLWAVAVLFNGLLASVAAGQVQTLATVDGKVAPTAKTQSCVDAGCHEAVIDHKVMHGPVAQDKCLACHDYDQPKQHTFKLVEDADELCVSCHTLKHRTVVHEPVKQGQCSGCHDPHGSEHQMILTADPTRGLCVSCHEQEGFNEKKYKHGPVAAGACILCHEAHSAWEPKLLVEKIGDLCQSCHSEVLGQANENRHVHAPLAEGACADCHDPHASDIEYQLVQASPGLCFSCHEDLQKQLAEAPVVHGVMSKDTGCVGCHTAHASQLPKLQRESQPQMCLSCHNETMQTSDGRTLTNMAALLKESTAVHGPIREGSCTACHQPHAGERHNMLVKEYPPQFYAPFSAEQYALCFSCHRSELVEDKKGIGLTRFRKDDVNLHWLHVNREKGRTCRACHEVHASSNPFHMRDAVPFGKRGWLLEINFKQTTTGGSCSPGCHEQQEYDHGQVPLEQPATRVRSEITGSANTGAEP